MTAFDRGRGSGATSPDDIGGICDGRPSASGHPITSTQLVVRASDGCQSRPTQSAADASPLAGPEGCSKVLGVQTHLKNNAYGLDASGSIVQNWRVHLVNGRTVPAAFLACSLSYHANLTAL